MIAVAEIIARVHDLPSLPAVVLELLASMEQDDIDAAALAAKITLDQALTAKTLRLANSSFYGMPSQVMTMQQAITVLGIHSIRTLVTACSITASFAPGPGMAFDFESFWRHSIATAVCARALAPRVKLSPDTAFTAGLLHDLGTLVLATRFPAEHAVSEAERRLRDCDCSTAEQAVFGTDHAAIGSALAAHWKFPQQIQAAVASHHDHAAPVAGARITLATVIQVANVLAHALDLSGQEDEQVPVLSRRTWQALALTPQDCLALFAETEQVFHDMCQILVS